MKKTVKAGIFCAHLCFAFAGTTSAAQPDPISSPGSINTNPTPSAQGSEERVSDTAYAIMTSAGTVSVYPGLGKAGRTGQEQRFYVAPKFSLKELRKGVYAETVRLVGVTRINMALRATQSATRAEVARRLSEESIDKQATPSRIGNLKIAQIRIDLDDENTKKAVGIEPFDLRNPSPDQEFIPVNLRVLPQHADVVANSINKGAIGVAIQYTFNNITLDKRSESLTADMVIQTQAMRDLTQSGDRLMTSNQVADFTHGVKMELSSIVIQGLGKIDAESISVDKILERMSLPDYWKKTNEDLKIIEENERKRLDLHIDLNQFQPYRWRKHVIEVLNKTRSVADAKHAYSKEEKSRRLGINTAGGVNFGIWKAGGDGSYSDQTNTFDENNSDNAFFDFLKKHEGIEYEKEETEFRGIRLFDTAKLRSIGSMVISSVTVKPTLGAGIVDVRWRAKVDSGMCQLRSSAICGVKTYVARRDPACGVERYQFGRGFICGVRSYRIATNPDCGVDHYKVGDCLYQKNWLAKEENSVARVAVCRTGTVSLVPEPVNKQVTKPLFVINPKYKTRDFNCTSHNGDPIGGTFHYSKVCEDPLLGVDSYKSCATEKNGVEEYNSCRNEVFGVESYQSCRKAEFGPEEYNDCLVMRTELGDDVRCDAAATVGS